MASNGSDSADAADPNNDLVHRQNLRRMEGESLRDSILAVSGRLDTTMYGPPVKVYLTPFMTGFGQPKDLGPMDGAGRRSIYQEVRRNYLPSMMLAFDTPAPAGTVGRRNVSNVPAQALILMNDPFVAREAKLWAERTLANSNLSIERPVESTKDHGPAINSEEPSNNAADLDAQRRIEVLFLEAFARPPSAEERGASIDFVKRQAKDYGDSAWTESRVAWADLCRALFNAKEFLFVQ
jgi:hypothetical protein